MTRWGAERRVLGCSGKASRSSTIPRKYSTSRPVPLTEEPEVLSGVPAARSTITFRYSYSGLGKKSWRTDAISLIVSNVYFYTVPSLSFTQRTCSAPKPVKRNVGTYAGTAGYHADGHVILTLGCIREGRSRHTGREV